MEITIEIDGRKFRPLEIGGNWAKSQFEYFHAGLNEWRRVNNWDRRAQLFDRLFAPVEG